MREIFLSRETINRDSIGLNKTYEHHNQPPCMPFKFASPNNADIMPLKVQPRRSITPKA